MNSSPLIAAGRLDEQMVNGFTLPAVYDRQQSAIAESLVIIDSPRQIRTSRVLKSRSLSSRCNAQMSGGGQLNGTDTFLIRDSFISAFRISDSDDRS